MISLDYHHFVLYGKSVLNLLVRHKHSAEAGAGGESRRKPGASEQPAGGSGPLFDG